MLKEIAIRLILLVVMVSSLAIVRVINNESGQQTSIIEGRKLTSLPVLDSKEVFTALKLLLRGDPAQAEEFYNDQFKNRTYQARVESAVVDNFLFRLNATKFKKAIERSIIRAAYRLTSDQAMPADMKDYIYITRDGSRLLQRPVSYNENKRDIYDTGIENYRQLLALNPEINFLVFHTEIIEYSLFHPLNEIFPESDRGQGLAYFEQHLPDGLKFGKMVFNNYEHYDSLYHTSDHHWNIHGILEAYEGIHQLLTEVYPAISPMQQPVEFRTFPDIDFLGAYARKTLYPITPEIFEVAIFDLPSYQVYRNGKETTYGNKEKYLAGDYPRGDYINHYGEYYGTDYALLEFVSRNGSTRNIAVFGSSADNPLIPLIASHYFHTYSVDLRLYDDFSLSSFLAEHPVDDILIIGENWGAFGVEYWQIHP